jgi:hypothetical protein
MEEWTVVGIDDEAWTGWTQHVTAKDEYEAMRIGAERERAATHRTETVVVVGAIKGRHTLHHPGCDNTSLSQCDVA